VIVLTLIQATEVYDFRDIEDVVLINYGCPFVGRNVVLLGKSKIN
jgi:hypothetical protein